MGHVAHALPHATAFGDTCERRRPEESVLYQTLEAHWDSFVERAEQQGGLPKFVLREVKEYLDCGIPERGCGRRGMSEALAIEGVLAIGSAAPE